MRKAKIAIIGGGVIGASIACHLAERGCENVLLLERAAAPGCGSTVGSTGRATGGFRAQFASDINVRLSLLSRAKLETFHSEFGVDPGYDPCGYLFLARCESELTAMRSARTTQQSAGLRETQEVTVAEVERLNPTVAPDQHIGGVYCPTDGFISPLEIWRGYFEAALRRGVQCRWATECVGFDVRHGRIARVRTATGDLPVDVVINAAGAWAGQVARLAGVELPVVPGRRQVASTFPTELFPARMPMTVFAEDWFHMRMRGGRALLLWPTESSSADPFSVEFDPHWCAGLLARAHARIPLVRQLAIDFASSWAGLYEMSPDGHAILGAAPDVPNLFFANGSSGHGVMHAPALGQLLAEIVVDGAAHSLDVRALRPERFAAGELNEQHPFL
ncbi:MAG: NAD(P)/FAD-dependent oxidoreductase [Planctomycetota bacterium]